MIGKLVQRRHFRRRIYELTSENIRVHDRTPLGGETYDVPYDVLFGDRIDHTLSSYAAFILAVIATPLGLLCCLVLYLDPPDKNVLGNIALTCGFTLAGVVGLIYWPLSRHRQIQLVNGQYTLWVRRDRPTEEAVDAFLESALQLGRERLRRRLLPLVPSGDARRDRRFAIVLRDKGLITAEEYKAFVHHDYTPARDATN
jgi:hypothetical protein